MRSWLRTSTFICLLLLQAFVYALIFLLNVWLSEFDQGQIYCFNQSISIPNYQFLLKGTGPASRSFLNVLYKVGFVNDMIKYFVILLIYRFCFAVWRIIAPVVKTLPFGNVLHKYYIDISFEKFHINPSPAQTFSFPNPF